MTRLIKIWKLKHVFFVAKYCNFILYLNIVVTTYCRRFSKDTTNRDAEMAKIGKQRWISKLRHIYWKYRIISNRKILEIKWIRFLKLSFHFHEAKCCTEENIHLNLLQKKNSKLTTSFKMKRTIFSFDTVNFSQSLFLK